MKRERRRARSLALEALYEVDSVGHSAEEVIERIRVDGPFGTLAERVLTTADSTSFAIQLANPLMAPVNTPVDMDLSCDIADSATLGAYRIQVVNEGEFDARDSNSGSEVTVEFAEDLHSGNLIVKAPATS